MSRSEGQTVDYLDVFICGAFLWLGGAQAGGAGIATYAVACAFVNAMFRLSTQPQEQGET